MLGVDADDSSNFIAGVEQASAITRSAIFSMSQLSIFAFIFAAPAVGQFQSAAVRAAASAALPVFSKKLEQLLGQLDPAKPPARPSPPRES